MAKKGFRISQEIKKETLNRIKNEGVSVAQAATDNAILHRPPPRIIHSDQGSEYASKDYSSLVQNLGIQQSMSRAGCPWENGYQESFYKGFKQDLGDPNRFETLGELVAGIYKTINYYNRSRIHTALGMSPLQFATKNSI